MVSKNIAHAIERSISRNEKYLRTQFEYFHAHPELSYQEVHTTAKLRELLEEAGIEVIESSLETGLVARIQGEQLAQGAQLAQGSQVVRGSQLSRNGQPGPTVALRADIDALPIQEETNLPYASRTQGVMHACGHDFHITTILGAALALHAAREQLSGTYLILFQPAEESSLGAVNVLKTGILDGVDGIIGTHASAGSPVGHVGIQAGAVTAAVDRFAIRLSGTGTHAARPHLGNDLVLAAASLVQELQRLRARVFDPQEGAILSIAHMSAGSTWNVLPSSALLEGTLRTLSPDSRSVGEATLRQITAGIAQTHGIRADIEWIAGPPATNNDPNLAKIAWSAAQSVGLIPGQWGASLVGEDFALYQQRIPGIFAYIGTGEQGGGLHTSTFRGDPAVIPPAARFVATAAVEIAQNLSQEPSQAAQEISQRNSGVAQ